MPCPPVRNATVGIMTSGDISLWPSPLLSRDPEGVAAVVWHTDDSMIGSSLHSAVEANTRIE